MNRIETRQPFERTPKTVIAQFLGEVSDIYGLTGADRLSERNIQQVIAKDKTGKILGQGWYINVKPLTNPGEFPRDHVAAFVDFDDTIAKTSHTKSQFWDTLEAMVPEQDAAFAFRTAAEAINQAARVIPHVAGEPSEAIGLRHAPLLEMLALSEAFDVAMDGPLGDLPSDKEAATRFIRKIINNQSNTTPPAALKEGLEFVSREEEGVSYFQEKDESVLLIGNDESCPSGVKPFIWDAYQNIMTQPEMPENEQHQSDLPDNYLFIPATLGQTDNQMRKLLHRMKQWKEHNGRLPDGILLITAGVKPPLIEQLVEDLGLPAEVIKVLLDDRPPRKEYVESTLIGRTFRADVHVPNGAKYDYHRIVDMTEASFRLATDITIFSYPNRQLPEQ